MLVTEWKKTFSTTAFPLCEHLDKNCLVYFTPENFFFFFCRFEQKNYACKDLLSVLELQRHEDIELMTVAVPATMTTHACSFLPFPNS